jgi:hypothetical protein
MKRTPLKRKTPLRRGKAKLKRTKLRQVSKRQRAKLDLYTAQRRVFLAAHPKCQVCGERPATDVHHMAGRGIRLNDESTFLATCRACHDWIHAHPAEARERGFLA